MNVTELKKLKPNQLRRTINPPGLPPIDEIKPEEFLGQERAIKALNFGLNIEEDVFHIFLSGAKETGKTTLVKTLLKNIVLEKTQDVRDWCYVQSFEDPKKAEWISFPPGEGKQFRKEIRRLIKHLLESLKKAEADLFEKSIKKKKELINKFNERAGECGLFAGQAWLQERDLSPFKLWFRDEKEQSLLTEEFVKSDQCPIPQEEKERILKNFDLFRKPFEELERSLEEVGQKVEARVRDIKENEIIMPAIKELGGKYQSNERALKFLEKMGGDVKKNMGLFDLTAPVQFFDRKEGICKACNQMTMDNCPIHGSKGVFIRYEVKVLVDNSKAWESGAPLVVKNVATYYDLFGKIGMEFEPPDKFHSDHTMILPGALHEANGGFLVLKANDLLIQPLFVPLWQRLIHALKTKTIKIETIPSITGFENSVSAPITAEPIPLNVKIILIGSDSLYHILLKADELLDFTRVFKVKAQMELDMPLDDRNILKTLGFIRHYCESENLLLPDREALARILEFFMEVAHSQEKLTLMMGRVKELFKEANYYAKQNRREHITLVDINQAILAEKERLNLYEERLREYVVKDFIKIRIKGEEVGQINGLSVFNLGDYVFGSVSRITALVHLGKEGVVSIDRESELSGPIHGKGVIILANCFRAMWGAAIPLAFNASLCFEQSYGVVDGDSASSTELYALLSAFSEVPIKQGIAVTGSIDQHGNVQPIGGINEKIRGFFEICSNRGFTGEQGVIVPQSNISELMLGKDIIEAVENGQFNIWPVERIEEGIEILTGMPFGGDNFEGDCIYKKVQFKLASMAKKIRDFWKPEER